MVHNAMVLDSGKKKRKREETTYINTGSPVTGSHVGIRYHHVIVQQPHIPLIDQSIIRVIPPFFPVNM